jgi:hypothetical protein
MNSKNYERVILQNHSFTEGNLGYVSFRGADIRVANFTNTISLVLSCTMGLTICSSLLPFPSASIVVQASEIRTQSFQDGVIQACQGQRINLGTPQLTNVELKALVTCDTEAIPQLLEALKAQDWKVKVIAAHALVLQRDFKQPKIVSEPLSQR